MNDLCAVPGCSKPVKARGLCDWCYKLARGHRVGEARRATLARKHLAPYRGGGTCRMPGCENPSETRGLCKGCYENSRRSDGPKARLARSLLLPSSHHPRPRQSPKPRPKGDEWRPASYCPVCGRPALDGPLCKRHLMLASMGDPADAETQAAVKKIAFAGIRP